MDPLDEPRIDRLSWPVLSDALDRTQTLLLPVGSTEQHGRHLPLGVDTIMPERLAERVASQTACLVAPSIPYGVSPHHTFRPGTVTIESETFQRYVRDVGESVSKWGVENVLLLNGHYLAQDPELDVVVRELRTECDLHAFHVPLIETFADAAREARASDLAFHAAEFETSLLLELAGDLVSMDDAVPVEPGIDAPPLCSHDALSPDPIGWALSAEDMEELTAHGNVGDPTGATRETGRKLADAAVETITELVNQLEAETETDA